MAVYRVQAPDGSVLRIDGPDNANEGDLINAAQQHYAQQQTAQTNPAMQGGSLSIGPFDTGIRTSPAVDQTLAGIGSGFMGYVQGAKQRLGMLSPQQVDATRAQEAPLRATTPGAVGSFLGQAIPAAATLPIPGANTYTGAALAGAALGGLQPTGSQDPSALASAGLGALGGVAGQGASNLVGRMIAPIRSSLSTEDARLAGVLRDSGVPMDLAQQTNSKPLTILNSVFQNLPFTSGAEEAKRAAQQAAFNQAVLAKGGITANAATPEVVKAGLDTAGQTIGNIAKGNSINIDGPLIKDLIDVYEKYQNVLEPNQRALIGSNINAILNERGILPGEVYQNTRSTLGRLTASTDPNVVQAAKGIRQALDDAASRSLNPEDLGAFNAARQNYAVMKTVGNAVKGGGGVSGDISPVQLRQAVSQANPSNYVKGVGDLNDLSRAGYRFLRDPIQNSGTTQRGYYQGLLTQGIGGLALGGGAYGVTGDPTKAAEGLVAPFLGPVLAQKALNSGLLGNYLLSGPARGLLAAQTARFLSPALIGSGAALARPQ